MILLQFSFVKKRELQIKIDLRRERKRERNNLSHKNEGFF